ncbi:MAG TPA: DUF3047 domain-containing protein [Gammaproteobacteria bacterium]|nr:DUF3047 domain-containing protein [Gammaproteobacteria bacterium]
MAHHNPGQSSVTVLSWRLIVCSLSGLMLFAATAGAQDVLDLGLSRDDFIDDEVPRGWSLRRWSPSAWNGDARWVNVDGEAAVRLSSNGALTFLEKTVDIDLRRYPRVRWQWRVENILEGIDERTRAGDDHPIRLFFVFEPDEEKQSLWFRIKRFLYLDLRHGHPFGGRFIEYLWSSHLAAGTVIDDPGKPWQKLMVIEGGAQHLGQWLSYERNLYADFKALYQEEPRRLIFIGILNDTDQTGQQATSYVRDLQFLRAADAP